MSGNQHPSVTDASVETSAACPSGQAPVFEPVKGERSLLLHICCGPCSIMPVKRLQDEGFTVTAWYMNPNIQPLMEYLRRREAAEECAARLGIELICQDDTWDLVGWLRSVAGRDLPPQRCAWCCSSRMQAAVAYARAHGYAHVSSSLLYSRYQPHDVIRAAREHAAAAEDAPLSEGPRFVYRDFRTDWQAGIDFSKEWGVYRQPYCGCVYSEAERYDKKLQRLIKKS